MASRSQCDNFVRNAWKKDLCSNCFKSKEEHKSGVTPIIPTKIPPAPKDGILKGGSSRNKSSKNNKVVFPSQEFEVIGFGGDDDYSDDDDLPNFCKVASEDDVDDYDDEEAKAFQKLTKSNTDFNSIPENLQQHKEGEVKKIVEPLKLGSKVVDDKGKKKTLLVSVTPFGAPAKPSISVSKNTVAHDVSINSISNGEESAPQSSAQTGKTDVKQSIVEEKLSAKVELEVEEPAEQMKDNAQITNIETVSRTNHDSSIKRSQPLDKNSKYRPIKDTGAEDKEKTIVTEVVAKKEEEELVKELNDKNSKVSEKLKASEKVSNLLDKAKKKVHQLHVISDAQNLKTKASEYSLLPSKRATVESQVKQKSVGLLLDMYEMNDAKDTKPNNDKTDGRTTKSVLPTSEMRNKFLSAELKMSSSILEVRKEKTDTQANVVKVEKSPERPKLTPNESSLYRHFKKAVKSVEVDKPSATCEAEDPITLKTTDSIVPSIVYQFNEGKVDVPQPTMKNQQLEIECDDVTDSSGSSLQENGEYRKTSLENYERIIGGEEVTLYSADQGGQMLSSTVVLELTRESAGEPDGRADSDDLSEPPALPSNPPPQVDPCRAPFLEELTIGLERKMYGEKPKVPTKPILIQSKKINYHTPSHANRPKSPSMEKFLDMTSSPQPIKAHPPLQESPSSDMSKGQKRQAPKPPSPRVGEGEDSDCSAKEDDVRVVPATRENSTRVPESPEEIPKFERILEEPVRDLGVSQRVSRSSDNLIELIKEESEECGQLTVSPPEPTPRRSLSLSQDSLLSSGVSDVQSKKKPSRGRFSLRKLLHLGKHNKESPKQPSPRRRESAPALPSPKPKLEIIHPLDLSGARVEVVPPVRSIKSRRTSSSASSSSGEQRESDVLSDSSASHSLSSSGNDSHTTVERAKKPPPPPRSQSLDQSNWAKPARPPPPKVSDIQRSIATAWTAMAVVPPVNPVGDNLYVNLGEARTGLAPNKPVRTGSLRDAGGECTKRLTPAVSQPEDSGYESFDLSLNTAPSVPTDDNVYECVQVSSVQLRSASPDLVSTISGQTTTPGSPSYVKTKRCSARTTAHRRSDGSVEASADYAKFRFMRSVSLPYCPSETESEVYSPYSFYGSELGEDDYEWTCTGGGTTGRQLRMSRLKLKKGRSVVHKSLEDNYGAVIIANHEALSQVVEHMHQGPAAPPALRNLASAANPRWADFLVAKDALGVVVERRVFYPALWAGHPVTLSVVAEQGLSSSLHNLHNLQAKGSFCLNPITELSDLVPASYLPMVGKEGTELVQASISVLTRLQIDTLQTYGRALTCGVVGEDVKKEANFVLLQLINAVKSLQAQGIEEAPAHLSNLVVCQEERDPHPRVCILHSSEREPKASLCQCILTAISEVLPPTELTSLVNDIVGKEKAVSLSQAKSVLEYTLWGPVDIAFGSSAREREGALQRWLDLERATVLHGLVRTRAELTVFEEWHLVFLVRTTAAMMAEASLLIESGVRSDEA